MTTALLILTLNEIDGVKKIIPEIKREWVDEILVVDGGSTDGTVEEVKKMGLNIIQQETRGHGQAILTGVNHTKSNNIVVFGPDGNHEPEEIKRLVEKINDGYDQVIISRFTPESINLDAGKIDTFGNKFFSFIANVFFGGNMTDVLNESRIITRDAMKQLDFDAMTADSTYQMSIRGMKLKQKIFEIPGNEGERIGGKRKIHSFSTGCLLLKRFFIELNHR